jgi:hypothetical protein
MRTARTLRSYLDVLTRVSERTGACIILIHHSRKPNLQNGGTETHAIRGSAAIFDACQSVFFFTGDSPKEPTRVKQVKDRIHGTPLDEFGIMADDVPGESGPRHALVVRHLEADQLTSEDSERENAKEERAVEQAAERIVLAICNSGFAFHGSAASLKAIVKGRTEVFKAAWAKLVSFGILVREGSHRDPIWRLVSDSVPSVSFGPDPVPDRESNPVPGPLPFREGTVLQHDADTPTGPKLLGPGNLFRNDNDSDGKEWWER